MKAIGSHRFMQRVSFTISCVAMAGIAFGFALGNPKKPSSNAPETATQNIALPDGYRTWKLISVAHEAGKLNDIRAILGNDAAFKASRRALARFPDGAMIARIAWTYMPSAENNKVFGNDQSFVAGVRTNIQLLVKDSRKYRSTGGWGFAQFNPGHPFNEAVAAECFACHVPAEANDYVFTRYAP